MSTQGPPAGTAPAKEMSCGIPKPSGPGPSRGTTRTLGLRLAAQGHGDERSNASTSPTSSSGVVRSSATHCCADVHSVGAQATSKLSRRRVVDDEQPVGARLDVVEDVGMPGRHHPGLACRVGRVEQAHLGRRLGRAGEKDPLVVLGRADGQEEPLVVLGDDPDVLLGWRCRPGGATPRVGGRRRRAGCRTAGWRPVTTRRLPRCLGPRRRGSARLPGRGRRARSARRPRCLPPRPAAVRRG